MQPMQDEEPCVFCQIRAAALPASFVLDAPRVYAIMSLEQPNPYKVLVVAKAHIPTIFDLSDELAASIFQATVRVSRAVRAASGCSGINIVQSSGAAAQQDVFHFHLHIVPRHLGDRITLQWDNAPMDRGNLDRLAAEIRRHL